MSDTNPTAFTVAHRLLFDALLELRAAGHESGDKRVFHLADLFHHIAFDLESAAMGDVSYDEVLRRLSARADDKGCERWLAAAIDRAGTASPGTPPEQSRLPDGVAAEIDGLGVANVER